MALSSAHRRRSRSLSLLSGTVLVTQQETEEALREMCRDFVRYAREQMVRGGPVVPTSALVVTPEQIAVLTVLDPSQRISIFRDAVQSLGGTGIVFVHDEWIIFNGARVKAVLVLWASQWGTAEGLAHCYENTAFGARFGVVVVADADQLSPYVQVFSQQTEAE